MVALAEDGKKHSGIYKDAKAKTKIRLQKSIISHIAQAEEHSNKLKNPSSFDRKWGEKDERAKAGLVKKWKKDLNRNAEQAAIEFAIWKERFSNE